MWPGEDPEEDSGEGLARAPGGRGRGRQVEGEGDGSGRLVAVHARRARLGGGSAQGGGRWGRLELGVNY